MVSKDVLLLYTPYRYSFLMESYSHLKRIMFRIIEILCAKRNAQLFLASQVNTMKHRNSLRKPNILNIKDLNMMLEIGSYKVEFYNKCYKDVFLLASLWEELLISLLEAMYMKKLCLVSDVIGNHDVLHNGENGFICIAEEEFKMAIQKQDYSETYI